MHFKSSSTQLQSLSLRHRIPSACLHLSQLLKVKWSSTCFFLLNFSFSFLARALPFALPMDLPLLFFFFPSTWTTVSSPTRRMQSNRSLITKLGPRSLIMIWYSDVIGLVFFIDCFPM